MKKNKVIAGLIVCSLLTVAALLTLIPKGEVALGSSVVGNDYKGRELTTSNGSTTPLVLKTGAGSIGSVVITVPASAGNMKFYDSASTTATTSASLMMGFASSSDVAGTYTFDREFYTGLQVDVPVGFDGQYTVTWR